MITAPHFTAWYKLALRKRSKQALWSWMEDNLRFQDSPYGKRFQISESPWLKGPLEAQQDPEVQELVVCAGAQLGKTTLIQGGLCWSLVEDPSPTMVVIDTLEAAKDLAENKLNPVLDDCDLLSHLMPRTKTGRKKLRIHFPHANLLIGPANNSFLRSHTIKRGFGSECAKWPPGAMKNFRARAKRYPNRQFLFESTPLEEWDDFWQAYLAGTQEEWGLRCEECEELFVPNFREVITWEDSPTTRPKGQWDYRKVRETVRMVCPHCERAHKQEPEVIRRMNDRGGYVVRNPGASGRTRSFRFNSLILPPSVLSWGDLVEEFLKAKQLVHHGFTDPLKQFVNLQLAEPWRQEEYVDEDPIEISIYTPDTAWRDEKKRYLTFDCQKELEDFWAVARAWGTDGASRLLDFRRPRSFDEIEEFAEEFKIPPNRVFGDVQYMRTQVVIELAKRRWHGLEGADDESFAHYEILPNGSKRTIHKCFSKPVQQKGLNLPRAPHIWRWSNPAVKDILQKLKTGDGAEWLVRDVGKLTDQYQAQMNSEHKISRMRRGKEVMVWEKIGHRGNHAWDCECMQIVVAVIQRVYGAV